MWTIEEQAVALTTAMTLCSSFFIGLEYLFCWRKGMFSEATFFAWSVTRAKAGWLYRTWPLGLLNSLFSKKGFLCLVVARLLLAMLAWICLSNSLSLSLCLWSLFGLACLFNIRHFQGKDGADEVMTILLFGLASYYTIGRESPFRWIGPIFIVAQVSLSYFISGYYKLISKTWRSGLAAQHVLATTIYGQPSLLFTMKNQTVSRVACWVIFLWELTFPLIFVLPFSYAGFWLLMGVGFHLTMACIMGLNTFMMTFLSSYPLFVFLLHQDFLSFCLCSR